jgi:hypothetical protein
LQAEQKKGGLISEAALFSVTPEQKLRSTAQLPSDIGPDPNDASLKETRRLAIRRERRR